MTPIDHETGRVCIVDPGKDRSWQHIIPHRFLSMTLDQLDAYSRLHPMEIELVEAELHRRCDSITTRRERGMDE